MRLIQNYGFKPYQGIRTQANVSADTFQFLVRALLVLGAFHDSIQSP